MRSAMVSIVGLAALAMATGALAQGYRVQETKPRSEPTVVQKPAALGVNTLQVLELKTNTLSVNRLAPLSWSGGSGAVGRPGEQAHGKAQTVTTYGPVLDMLRSEIAHLEVAQLQVARLDAARLELPVLPPPDMLKVNYLDFPEQTAPAFEPFTSTNPVAALQPSSGGVFNLGFGGFNPSMYGMNLGQGLSTGNNFLTGMGFGGYGAPSPSVPTPPGAYYPR